MAGNLGIFDRFGHHDERTCHRLKLLKKSVILTPLHTQVACLHAAVGNNHVHNHADFLFLTHLFRIKISQGVATYLAELLKMLKPWHDFFAQQLQRGVLLQRFSRGHNATELVEQNLLIGGSAFSLINPLHHRCNSYRLFTPIAVVVAT